MCAFTGTFCILQRQARGTLDGTNGPVMMTVYIQCVSLRVCMCVCCDYTQNIKTHLKIIQMLSNWAHPNSLLLFPFFFSPPLSLSLADKRPWRSLTKQVGNTLHALLSSAPPCCLHLLQTFCSQQAKIIMFPLLEALRSFFACVCVCESSTSSMCHWQIHCQYM